MLFCVARALFRHMEWRYHGVPWPSVTLTPVDLASHFVKRMNEASVGNMHAYNNIMHLSQLYNKCCGTVSRL